MQIGILGSVTLTVDTVREIRANRVRTMLAMLVLEHGTTVSHDELIDELWSGRPLGNALNALQSTASRLRRLASSPGPHGGDPLRSVRNGYLLDIPRDSVDANRFLDIAARGATMASDRPEQAVELLQAGLRLWRGPALLDAGDGLRCRAAAALFEERRLAVWEDLITARLTIGDENRAIPELRQLVGTYPLRERFRDQLMLALYRAGRQGDAIELYHQTRQLLDRELGLQPAPTLQRRYTEILTQDPALVLPSAAWPTRREAEVSRR